LACWRGAWWRQTFNFSHILPLFGEFFIPCEEFLPRLFLPCLLLYTQENLERHGDEHGSVIVVENNQPCSDTT
jgi:hypothetical protein